MKTIRKYLAKFIGTFGMFLVGIALMIEFGPRNTLVGLQTLVDTLKKKLEELENPIT